MTCGVKIDGQDDFLRMKEWRQSGAAKVGGKVLCFDSRVELGIVMLIYVHKKGGGQLMAVERKQKR